MSESWTRRDVLKSAAAAAVGATVGGCHSMTPTSSKRSGASLIVHNAKITTLDPVRLNATALVAEAGRFTHVGDESLAMRHRGPNTKVIDAGGRRIIPGLIDSHIHVIRGGLNYNLELRWDGVTSLADALSMLRRQAERTVPPQWVRVVGGWSEFQFKERRLPTLAEINAVSPDVPVFVLHLYDRALLNGAALRAVGYTKDTPDPPGGFIERDARGNPTGLMIARPNAFILYKTLSLGPKLAPADQLNSTRHFMRELNRLGLTSIIDAGGGFQNYPEDYAIVEKLHRDGQLTLRLAYNLFTQNADKELGDFEKWVALTRPYKGDDFYRMNGAGEMLVFSAADFEDFLEPRPDLSVGMENQLTRVVTLLAKNRWPFRLHATYDESISRFLNVFEAVNKEIPWGDLRWFFDHAETISDRNIDRVKALGGGIAIQHRMAYQGEYFVDRYGPEAVKRTPPIRRMLEVGLPVGAGTDATRVASYNPWVALYWLVTGKTVGGMGMYPESNRLDRAEALRLFTSGSAWFSGEESTKGVIKPGKFADFAVLSADYFEVPEDEIKNIDADLTIVDGKVVNAQREFTHLAPPLPPPSPDWSPVAAFGGYGAPALVHTINSRTGSRASTAGCGCGASAPGNSIQSGVSNACGFWGALGCDCFAF